MRTCEKCHGALVRGRCRPGQRQADLDWFWFRQKVEYSRPEHPLFLQRFDKSQARRKDKYNPKHRRGGSH